MHALVPSSQGRTTCRPCTANDCLKVLTQMQLQEQPVTASLDAIEATPRMAATAEAPTQGGSSTIVTVPTGNNDDTAKEAVDSRPEPTGQGSSSPRLLSNSEDGSIANQSAAVSGSRPASAPALASHSAYTPSAVVSRAEVARVCVATGPPPAVAGGAPVASTVAAPETAGTAEKVGERTAASTAAESSLASPEGSLRTKASTSPSNSPSLAPLDVAADIVPCPIADTPCSPGGADSRELLLPVEAAPTQRLGPPLAGPKGVDAVGSSSASPGLVVPRASYFAPEKAAPAVVFAQEKADSITAASEEEPALSSTASQSRAAKTWRVAAPSLIPSKAAPPSSSPPASAKTSVAEAPLALPVGVSEAAAGKGTSAKPPLGTAGDGLQPEGGGAPLPPPRGVSPLPGGTSVSAAGASAEPLPTAGDDLPTRGDTQPVGGGSSSPAHGVSTLPAAETAAGGQLVDEVVTPSGLVVEIEEPREPDHDPTGSVATCIPAKNAVIAPQSPLSTLAHLAATSFGTSRSDRERGKSVSVDDRAMMDGATDEEAAVVMSTDVGGLASSVRQACKETVEEERGPSLQNLQLALSLLSSAVRSSPESPDGCAGLKPVFESLGGLIDKATRTRSVEPSSLVGFGLEYSALGNEMAAIEAKGPRSSLGGTRVRSVVGERGSDGVGTSGSHHGGIGPAEEDGASGARGGGGTGGGSGGKVAPSTPRELKFHGTGVVFARMISLEVDDAGSMLAEMMSLEVNDTCVALVQQ